MLARETAVTPVDVGVGIGWLHGSHVESWRQGGVGSLSEFLPVDDARLTHFLDCFDRWARASGLEPAEAEYVSSPRDEARDRIRRLSTAPSPPGRYRGRRHIPGLCIRPPGEPVYRVGCAKEEPK